MTTNDSENPEQPATPREKPARVKASAGESAVKASIGVGGLHFGQPRPSREKRERMKNDPQHVAMARELRDRWLEQVNEAGQALPFAGKYDVSRILPAKPATPVVAELLLPAA